MNVGIIVLIAITVVALFAVSIYNGLVSSRNRFKNAYSQIDVQLKRRYDLIPNLVETVKAYMSHERDTLEAVIAARNTASNARAQVASNPADVSSMKKLSQADEQLTGVVGRLFALSEAYPDLKANQNMSNLQEELTSTENKVAFSRQAFNDAVLAYNTSCEVFPNVLVARMFGFLPAQSFEISNDLEKEAPKVKF